MFVGFTDTVKECGLNLKHLGLRTTEPTFVSCLLVVDFEHSFVHVTSPTNRLPDNPHNYEPTDLQTKRQQVPLWPRCIVSPPRVREAGLQHVG